MILQGVANAVAPLLFSLKNIGFVYPFDGAFAEDKEQDQMEDQETAPDQEGDMNDPDGFLNRVKSQQKPCF